MFQNDTSPASGATGTKGTTPSITPSLFRPSECLGLTDRPPKPSEKATDDILGPLPFPDIDKFLIAEPLPWAKKDETVAVAVDEPINEDEDEEPYPDGPDNHQDETDDSIEEEKFNPRPPNLPLWARRLCEEEIQEGPEEGAIFLS